MAVDGTDVSSDNKHKKIKVRLVLNKSVNAVVERRCAKCGRLLMKELEKSHREPGSIEILCHWCKQLNKI